MNNILFDYAAFPQKSFLKTCKKVTFMLQLAYEVDIL